MQIAAVFSSQLALRGTSPPARTEQLLASDPPGPYSIGSDTWPGLATLAADAAQVVEVVSAITGNGDDTGPDAARLRESLQDQLGDLRAAIDYVIGKNALDWNAINRRRDRKRSRYERDHRPAPPPQPAAGTARHAPPVQPAAGNARHAPPGQPAAGTARHAPPDQPAAGTARQTPPDQHAAGNASPGLPAMDTAGSADSAPRQQGAAGTGRPPSHDQGADHSWPVPCQHGRLSRPAPARSARRPARARAATPSLPSSAE
jgi:hypothetical protein